MTRYIGSCDLVHLANRHKNKLFNKKFDNYYTFNNIPFMRKKQIMKKALYLLATLVLSTTAVAQNKKIIIGETLFIHSEILHEDRKIMVYLPGKYKEGTEKCPVVYVLDGGSHFFHTASSSQFLADISKAPDLIVVAITNTRRTRDMTTPDPLNERFKDNGGAADFASFIGKELMPFINKNYSTENHNILIGHSLAGFFTCYMMLNHTDLFDSYIAISPSLYWNNEQVVQQLEQRIENGNALNKYLYITYCREGSTGIITSVNRVITILEARAPKGLRWNFEYMPDEIHPSIPNRAVYEGLEGLFKGWMFRVRIKNATAEKMKHHYDSLSERFGFTCRPPENWLNIYGNETLNSGRISEAIEYFRYYTQLYPQSANAYDGLGGACMKAGDMNQAIASYKKSLKLDPDNSNAQNMLKKIRENDQ